MILAIALLLGAGKCVDSGNRDCRSAKPPFDDDRGRRRVRDQCSFRFSRSDETDRTANDRGRPWAIRVCKHVEQVKQCGRRVTYGDDGAAEMRSPELKGGGGAR